MGRSTTSRSSASTSSATFAGLAGAALDDGVVRDGVDLVPYLTGGGDGRPHDVLYWRAGPNRAVRMGRWKLFEVNRADPDASHGGGRLLPLQAYPDASPHGQVSLLYDLDDDEAERANLADRLPERLRDLRERLDRWESCSPIRCGRPTGPPSSTSTASWFSCSSDVQVPESPQAEDGPTQLRQSINSLHFACDDHRNSELWNQRAESRST